jgi:hypothetical protein
MMPSAPCPTRRYKMRDRLDCISMPCFILCMFVQGFNLLYYLEKTVGSKLFESFAKAYISK